MTKIRMPHPVRNPFTLNLPRSPVLDVDPVADERARVVLEYRITDRVDELLPVRVAGVRIGCVGLVHVERLAAMRFGAGTRRNAPDGARLRRDVEAVANFEAGGIGPLAAGADEPGQQEQ
jgi:hypothetical protein